MDVTIAAQVKNVDARMEQLKNGGNPSLTQVYKSEVPFSSNHPTRDVRAMRYARLCAVLCATDEDRQLPTLKMKAYEYLFLLHDGFHEVVRAAKSLHKRYPSPTTSSYINWLYTSISTLRLEDITKTSWIHDL